MFPGACIRSPAWRYEWSVPGLRRAKHRPCIVPVWVDRGWVSETHKVAGPGALCRWLSGDWMYGRG